jgi:hypothetical protein
MQIDRYGSWAALMLLAGAAGCAGNGQGLDQNGQPISMGGGSGGPITADFQSIQDNVFTPICSKCHIGGGAPEGLQLDAAHSYNLLVGVPSAEQPALLRVKPGDPDNSYMVRKIEGPTAGIIGAQMPYMETPLPQATIDAIRQWITNGAPNVPAAATAAAQMFAVQSTAPVDKAAVKAPPRIMVAFTQEVDASLVNETTVRLERITHAAEGAALASEAPAAGSAQQISAAGALAAQNPAVLLITPKSALVPGVYRVTLRGTGGGALANMSAATLGSDTSFEFTVEPAQ